MNNQHKFPFGVWLQDPRHVHADGKTTARHYRDMGINQWIGIHEWPSEASRYPGFNVHCAQALRDAGFVCYTGEDLTAVEWNLAHPEFQDVFIGYLIGDEPDMTKQWVPAHHPDAWRARCRAFRDADPSRGRYANFGKAFGKIPWVGLPAFPGPTVQDDHNKFTDFLTTVSVDLYGMTDKHEMPLYVGLWTYAKAIRNARYYVDANPNNPGLPVWGFVEAGNPFVQVGGLYPVMPPLSIPPAVWLMVCAGADGIIYFPQHRLLGESTGNYPIDHPHVGAIIAATNASVHLYADVLAAPRVGVASWTTGVGLQVRAHSWEGAIYVFACGDGDQAHRFGQTVTAGIVVDGISDSVTKMEVMGEARTVPLAGGQFEEQFAPYQLHIYRATAK